MFMISSQKRILQKQEYLYIQAQVLESDFRI